MALKIGELAAKTGASPPTIRYYEQIGLLPPAHRIEGKQRRYDDGDVKRLTFVRRCREMGFPIEQVRTLANLMQDPERSCVEARDMGASQLAAVRAKLVELRELEQTMSEFVERCDAACAGGPGPDCLVLTDLTQPLAETGCGRGSGCTP